MAIERSRFNEQYLREIGVEEDATWSERMAERVVAFLHEQHEDRESLGRGKTADVWRGAMPDFKEVCVKVLHTSGISVNNLEREFQLHEEFEAAGVRVSRPIGFVRDAEGGERDHALVMRVIEGETLKQLVARLDSERHPLARADYDHILQQLREQLTLAHRANLYHRDLHLDNVMLDRDGNISLIDFGDATRAIGTGDETEIYTEATTRNGRPVTIRYRRDENVIPEFSRELQRNGINVEG